MQLQRSLIVAGFHRLTPWMQLPLIEVEITTSSRTVLHAPPRTGHNGSTIGEYEQEPTLLRRLLSNEDCIVGAIVTVEVASDHRRTQPATEPQIGESLKGSFDNLRELEPPTLWLWSSGPAGCLAGAQAADHEHQC